MKHRSYRFNLGLLFDHVSEVYADHAALKYPDGELITYAELSVRVSRLVTMLLQHNVRKHSVVCIINRKSPEGFACMLACLRLGAVYANVDDQNPVDRLAKIFSTCIPDLVIVDGDAPTGLESICQQLQISILPLADATREIRAATKLSSVEYTGTAITATDPAYIMFTSGSTGTPKAVLISHGSVINFIHWSQQRFGITHEDILTNVNPIYFDNSVFDFYSALFSGACLAPFNREQVKDQRQLVESVGHLGCTIWFSVPSLLIYLMTTKVLTTANLLPIRLFVFGGEGYPKPALKKLFDLYAARSRLISVYGPTEGTCICSAYDITAADFDDLTQLPSLGQICENFSYLILNEEDQPVAENAPGELCLLGPNLGLGYYNQAENTRVSFCLNPLNKSFPEPMYRTGDLVWEESTAAGSRLNFRGRKDNQIKHMGYRIELEEIETALNSLSYVIQSAVVYQRNRTNYGRLVGFVSSDCDLKEQRIRQDLKSKLPDYMVPNQILSYADLPKNQNGKVDRRALLDSL